VRLVRYSSGSGIRTGVISNGAVIDAQNAVERDGSAAPDELVALQEMTALIALGTRGLKLLRAASDVSTAQIPLQSSRLCAPIEPRLILCSGENYWDHRQEKPEVEGREPEFFLKSPLGVVASGDPIALDPRVTRKLDYEVELLVVIGKAGRHIAEERALEHVFGYSIMNDVTARDRQVKLRPDGSSVYSLGPGKSFDTSAPIGPCIVTRDEIPDPQNLAIRSFVNGELRQDNHTSRMIWSVAQLVTFFSNYITLRPGVVISTGTPGGTGWGSDPELGGRIGGIARRAPSRYLSVGDEVVCEIENIGRLQNRVVAPSAS
jgi:2-keto-4-pentenoate hydratase/2-oxohepta-3-ene-1,7-dioic acid hydratase in catechol pathway